MACPFCSLELTEANAVKGGRYSCPSCAPTLREAVHGWLPRAQAPVVTRSATEKAEGLTRASTSQWFNRTASGDPVTRERSCECGRRFTQFQLSERFMEITEGTSKRAAALVLSQCPGLFVPVHCPACERRDIGHQSRLDDTRNIPPNYTERPDAA